VSQTLFVRTPRRSLPQLVVIAVAKAVVATLAVFAGYVATAVHSDFTDIAEGRRTPPAMGDVDPARVLIAEHDCSTTGFGDRVVPSALVRRDGRLALVSFDEGLAVSEGRLPGTLLALCLDPVD